MSAVVAFLILIVFIVFAFLVLPLNISRQEHEQAFRDWWEDSVFNSFEIVDKYKKELERFTQYWVVVKQIKTGRYYEIQVSVDMYYKDKIGSVVQFTKSLLTLDYLSELALCEEQKEAYNNEMNRVRK